MKLHKDGTIEGTPKEIAEYNRLQEHGKLMKERIEKDIHPNTKPLHPCERWDTRIQLVRDGKVEFL